MAFKAVLYIPVALTVVAAYRDVIQAIRKLTAPAAGDKAKQN